MFVAGSLPCTSVGVREIELLQQKTAFCVFKYVQEQDGSCKGKEARNWPAEVVIRQLLLNGGEGFGMTSGELGAESLELRGFVSKYRCETLAAFSTRSWT